MPYIGAWKHPTHQTKSRILNYEPYLLSNENPWKADDTFPMFAVDDIYFMAKR